jgi:hypothetical protein
MTDHNIDPQDVEDAENIDALLTGSDWDRESWAIEFLVASGDGDFRRFYYPTHLLQRYELAPLGHDPKEMRYRYATYADADEVRQVIIRQAESIGATVSPVIVSRRTALIVTEWFTER